MIHSLGIIAAAAAASAESAAADQIAAVADADTAVNHQSIIFLCLRPHHDIPPSCSLPGTEARTSRIYMLTLLQARARRNKSIGGRPRYLSVLCRQQATYSDRSFRDARKVSVQSSPTSVESHVTASPHRLQQRNYRNRLRD